MYVAKEAMCIKQSEPDDGMCSEQSGGEKFCTLFHVFYSTILSEKAVQNLEEKREIRELETHKMTAAGTNTHTYTHKDTHTWIWCLCGPEFKQVEAHSGAKVKLQNRFQNPIDICN